MVITLLPDEVLALLRNPEHIKPLIEGHEVTAYVAYDTDTHAIGIELVIGEDNQGENGGQR